MLLIGLVVLVLGAKQVLDVCPDLPLPIEKPYRP